MATKREFIQAVELNNEGIVSSGGARRGCKIVCGSCNREESHFANNHGGSIPVEGMIKIFSRKGWSVGSHPKWDRCPACVSKELQDKRKPNPAWKPSENGDAIVSVKKADPPPVMTKEDRRIIFAKIDEVYIDENSGYKPGWTDIKIALDLNVPRGWVTQIRSENFGDEGMNEDVRALVSEHEKLKIECEAMKDLLKTIDIPKLNGIREKIDAMERGMQRFDKEISRVTKIV